MRRDCECRVRIGVSACLLGQRVRYDGGHKRDCFITDVLGRFVEFVAICPEIEIGLGVPRETLRLERRAGLVHMVANETGTDHTATMRGYAERKVDGFEHLSGYILKSNSPSCGLESVRIYDERGRADGRGVFAETLIRRWSYLPVEEEASLGDALLRENFVERIFAYDRLRRLFAGRWTPASLSRFHADHELQLIAHAARAHSNLRRLMASNAHRLELQRNYQAGFMRAMSRVALPARHLIVLRRIADLVPPHCEPSNCNELDRVIAEYGAGAVSLTIPLGIAREYAQRFAIEYLKRQSYLEPYPIELMKDINADPRLSKDQREKLQLL
jgi:uncharacterized protein YbbK (DUF523 family)/uncharacterized protein YbgA (DUF1722 family)